MRRWLTVFTLGMLGWLSQPAPAQACTCLWVPTVEALDRSEAVFVGRVVDGRGPAVWDGSGTVELRPPFVSHVRFAVAQSWKGALEDEVSLTTRGGDCGDPFRIGQEYLVWAERAPSAGSDWYVAGSLVADHGSCGRTRPGPVAPTDEDVRWLTAVTRPGLSPRVGDALSVLTGIAVAVSGWRLDRRWSTR